MKRLAVLLFLFPFWHQGHGQDNSRLINVLIVDGFSNHDWKQTTKVVKSILETSGLFHISVSTSPSTPEDSSWKDWDPDFNNFDVVLLNCNNIQNKEIRWPVQVEEKLELYVSSGGGLYILHSANNAFSHWHEYNDMIGLGWRKPEEGIALQVSDNGDLISIPVGEGKATYHGPRNDEVIQKFTEHPINKNFPDGWKTPDMELYKFARGPAKNLTVLSYAKDEETGINWPVEWVVQIKFASLGATLKPNRGNSADNFVRVDRIRSRFCSIQS